MCTIQIINSPFDGRPMHARNSCSHRDSASKVDRAGVARSRGGRAVACGGSSGIGYRIRGRSRRPELRTLLELLLVTPVDPYAYNAPGLFVRTATGLPERKKSVSRPQAQCTESAVIMRCAVRPAMPDAPPRCFQLRRQSWRAAAAAGALIVGHRGSRARLCVVVVRGCRALIVSHRGGWREGGRRARTA